MTKPPTTARAAAAPPCTSGRLADGREIVFYDESPRARRVIADTRDLPPVTGHSEIRYDPLLDEWVALAAHRQARTFLPPADRCPLCPSGPGRATEIPAPDYDVVVFENRFPAFGGELGRCEVVCFSSDHTTSFSRLSPERVRLIVDVWADRTVRLAAHTGVEQVFCFENRGAEIGVTLDHPHGQIYGYPFLTPRTRRQLDSAHRHRDRTGRNLFADVLAAERDAAVRVVAETAHWTAFVPTAARWPVEVHLYPHRGAPDLPALTSDERDDLATLYLDLLARLDALHGDAAGPLPYMACWHQAPVHTDRDLARLHLEIFSVRRAPGRLKYLAGSESGMGVFINDTLPEQVAARLREIGPTAARDAPRSAP
ncbi:galactose-1-phosphate uridylyltransferase [Pseudonocardia bannensis]|uniref:Galactose-1-phosphate uridylyltransferase n=1 Tax=Pseudonocardia bannensis TaxID=630973 RepID=A0A848DDB4_9PSEU|nr:galactose-1-phosphate uridylyltransferase [Pseudonocardia bannensis]NMH90573.1 galactose-1-phosphate uridylyltransferase [Pseudonocardia bannensis]